MTADYRTRLIGFSHKHFLNIADIAYFFERENAEKDAGNIRNQAYIPG